MKVRVRLLGWQTPPCLAVLVPREHPRSAASSTCPRRMTSDSMWSGDHCLRKRVSVHSCIQQSCHIKADLELVYKRKVIKYVCVKGKFWHTMACSCHARTAHKGPLQKRLKEDCWIVLHVPPSPWPNQSKDWTGIFTFPTTLSLVQKIMKVIVTGVERHVFM